MRKIILLGGVVIMLAVVYGFAAANSVPETGAGEGSGTVSGYTITNVAYTLLSSDPSKLQKIAFDVAPTSGAGAASQVRITVNGGTTWVTCTGPTGTNWSCSFTVGSEPTVSSISSLRIVAVD
jgi:hypothetical protein